MKLLAICGLQYFPLIWRFVAAKWLSICSLPLLLSLSLSPTLPSRPVILCLAICRHFYDLQHCLSCCCFWGSQIVAFLMPHWNHICIGAHRYLCFSVFPLFHPSGYPLSALKAKTLTFCHIPPLAAIQFAPSAINHRQSSRVSFLPCPLKSAGGKPLHLFFQHKGNSFLCVYVCGLLFNLHWIMRERERESDFQTKIISPSSLFTNWEIISTEWIGIMASSRSLEVSW